MRQIYTESQKVDYSFKPKIRILLLIAALFVAFTPLWHTACNFNGCGEWSVNAPLFKGLGYLLNTFLGHSLLYFIVYFVFLLVTYWRWPDKRLFVVAVFLLWIPSTVLLRIIYPYTNSDLSLQLASERVQPLIKQYQNTMREKVHVGMARSEVYKVAGDPYLLHKKIKFLDEKYRIFKTQKSATGVSLWNQPLGRQGELKNIIVFDAAFAQAYDDRRQMIVSDMQPGEQKSLLGPPHEELIKALNENRVVLGHYETVPDFFGEEFFFNTVRPFLLSRKDKSIAFNDCEYYLSNITCYENDRVVLHAYAMFNTISRDERSGEVSKRYILQLMVGNKKELPIDRSLFQ